MKANGSWCNNCRGLLVLASTLLIAACGGISPPHAAIRPDIYVLEYAQAVQAAQIKHELVLAVGVPRTLAGFDTSQMAYVQQPHELNYFAASRWADTPARMLGPLIAHALEQTESFLAVVQSSGMLPADLRLDTELVRLQQDFRTHPSRVQLTMRAQLIDVRSKRLLAVRQFDDFETAASDDAFGGVAAANRLVQRMLGRVAEFCVMAPGKELKSGSDRP
jgi:cholesterol transport system auxiliary component